MKIHDVEQRSLEWYALRLGKPTASEFGKLVTSKGELSKSLDGYALTLAAELYAGEPVDAWEGNAWTERGRELEDKALTFYAFMQDKELQRVGFVTGDDGRYGCSPDALVETDGLAEVKCLKAENHVKAILYHQKHGRCPPDYVQQAQGQMMICERAWCDTIFYHPILPLLVVRQESIPDVWIGLRTALEMVMRHRDHALAALRRQAGEPTRAATPRELTPLDAG